MWARHARPLYALRADGLWPSSSPLDTPSRTGLIIMMMMMMMIMMTMMVMTIKENSIKLKIIKTPVYKFSQVGLSSFSMVFNFSKIFF
jgi:hypothetical protein